MRPAGGGGTVGARAATGAVVAGVGDGGVPRDATAGGAGAVGGRVVTGGAAVTMAVDGEVPRDATAGGAGAGVGRVAIPGVDVDGSVCRPGVVRATEVPADGAAAGAGVGLGADGASIRISAETVAKPTTIAPIP